MKKLLVFLVVPLVLNCKPRRDLSGSEVLGKGGKDCPCCWAAAAEEVKDPKAAERELEKSRYLVERATSEGSPEMRDTMTALAIENGKGTPEAMFEEACACNDPAEMKRRIANTSPVELTKGIARGLQRYAEVSGPTLNTLEIATRVGAFALEAEVRGNRGLSLALTSALQQGTRGLTIEGKPVAIGEIMLGSSIVAASNAVESRDPAITRKLNALIASGFNGKNQIGLSFRETMLPGKTGLSVVEILPAKEMRGLENLDTSARFKEIAQKFSGAGIDPARLERLTRAAETRAIEFRPGVKK